MAEDEETEEGKEAKGASGDASKKKLLVIAGAVLGVVLLVGVPVAVLSLRGGTPADAIDGLPADIATGFSSGMVPEGALDEDIYDEGEEPLGAFFPMEAFVVNLSGGRFLRAQVQIEFTGRDVPRRFYSRLVPIRDRMLQILSSKTADQLSEQRGRETLREELRVSVNELLRREEAKRVYFTQFVIQ